ncbi:MAG: vanadium-dependent haloperoxidase [Balneolaceae bacterium]|nr:vanadium-dependent haloperoxidase [Balneolaceae bacterium]
MNRFKSSLGVVTLIICIVSGCQEIKSPEEAGATNPDLLHDAMEQVTDIMVHDIFSPPVASRVHSYASIAAYETMALNIPEYQSLAGQINEFTEGPKNEDENVVLELASLHAFFEIGDELLFSTEMLHNYRDSVYKQLRNNGLSKKNLEASLAYGQQVADHVIAYLSTDNYKQTRGTEKYPVTDEPGRWIPTPPAYMDAIEPSWNKIRPFVMTSADQFKPVPPVPFSLDEDSEFYKQTYEVYEIGENLTDEQIEIAKFWDCNPFAMQLRGHFMFSIKKLTPGGHWMGIAGIVAKSVEADYAKSAATYALTSIALFDGFISSWDEKFRSNLIRPETVINQHIDPEWVPLLQTPPFPEYTSGHSVISRAAAEALTSIYGDEFYFEDTTELKYGLPVRSFNSFIEASDEAAVSRLYGGIHYRMAAEHGITQGEGVGRLVAGQISLENEPITEN